MAHTISNQFDLPREADLDVSPALRVYKLWCVLLYTYTRCGLKQAGDKLITLAGIANRVHQTMQDDYLAGVWKSWLMYDLCWHVDFFSLAEDPVEWPDTYRAPSWSWVTVDTPINLGGSVPIHPSAILACEILSTSATPVAQESPFGAVQAAELMVHATLCRLAVVPDPLMDSSPREWHRWARAGAARFQIYGISLPQMGIAVMFDDASSVPPTEQIWCFAVRREEPEPGYYTSDDESHRSDIPGEHEVDSTVIASPGNEPSLARDDRFIYGLVLTRNNISGSTIDSSATSFTRNEASRLKEVQSDPISQQELFHPRRQRCRR